MNSRRSGPTPTRCLWRKCSESSSETVRSEAEAARRALGQRQPLCTCFLVVEEKIMGR